MCCTTCGQAVHCSGNLCLLRVMCVSLSPACDVHLHYDLEHLGLSWLWLLSFNNDKIITVV